MTHSLPHLNSCIISFRCTTDLKKQIEDYAKHLHLTCSDLTRHSLMHIMNHPEALQDILPAENTEPTIAIVSREEEPIRWDAIIHHHIAFLNQEEHGYQGFRFTITWRKESYRRYFSPNNYGSMAAALAAAITVRDYVIEQLALRPNEPCTIYDEAKRIAPPPFPSSKRTRS